MVFQVRNTDFGRLAGCAAALALWLSLAPAAAAQAAGDAIFYPGPEQVPAWAQQGKFRFARLDGGPIETLKTARSRWGMHFTDADKEVLGNLYSKYGGRVVDLLGQANLNWVWITWSVGYSWQDESVQRDQCRALTSRLHEKGIHVTAYLCATSMFWESMFRDEPRSTRWITYDPRGVPYRYSGGRDPLRFIADIANPEWVAYEKRRIGAALDAGVDAIFLDNTADGPNDAMDRFIGQLRRYIREEKHSAAPLLTNYGLASNIVALNRNMEIVFNEHWMEPGVWGEDWNASNTWRTRYVRGVVPDWKPLISEYSVFHEGDRAHGWLKPKSARLGIAEAAAFRSAYAWDMEGPFDTALMVGDPSAMETWKAIGRYNGFLKDHEDLYVKARGTAPIAVLISERAGGPRIRVDWPTDNTGLYDLLGKNSVLHDIRLITAVDEAQLAPYAGVVLPAFVARTAEESAMLARYRAKGGKVLELPAGMPPQEILSKVRALAPDGMALAVEGAPHVLGNVTRIGAGKAFAIHVLNYNPEPVSGVRIRLRLDRDSASLAGAHPRLITPDAQTAEIADVRRNRAEIEFTIHKLDTYGVVVLE